MAASQAPATNAGHATKQNSANATNQSGVISWLVSVKENGLVPLLLGGAAFIGLMIALALWASTPDYRVLYSNLSEADGGEIIAELDARQIPYQLSASGAISVPSDQVHRLRLQMAEQGLPNAGNVGFSLLDNQAFGISQFTEKVNFQRALEGELASSIEALGPVQKARIHLAMAKDSVFVRDRQPAKASVVATLHPGRTLTEGQVQSVVHMISSSVANLSPDNVTVVDQHGSLLSSQSDNESLNGSKLDYVKQVESTYEKRIKSILTPFLGPENVQAQVVADVDFAIREATAERYTPNQTSDTAAVRSIQRNLNVNGNGAAAEGIPGAVSNTPPGVAASPIVDPANNDADTEPTANLQMQQDQVVNYEVDRTVEHIQHQQGVLQRLSVAVVVNHRVTLDANGEPQLEPRSPEELDHINRLVRQAMGYSDARGDQLEIVNAPFVTETHEVVESPWYEQQHIIDLISQLLKYAVVGIVGLMFYWLILRPLLKRRRDAVPTQGRQEPSTSKGQLRAVVGDEDDNMPYGTSSAEATTVANSAANSTANLSPSHNNYDAALTKAKTAAQQHPRQVAQVLQNWIAEEHNDQ
ncbi:Flagellar M-ring protein [Pseudidiomarina piscicola]|uniref:Flagellar M-ring protein n=1 Tax=Pseudidiomarina piscicola TaxID=2614830 RepID=A0A6S6WQ15_9GAMM|nr:flagellar basal-body MS-ring/collar protein FliF [Pseudidiomarina piscicola]CAB0151055.1 Flagellar M-ring protein [Pseudidiomarina piscicola]VZT40565.1 Flagellar M-ring protein [Pseudomonas aeruginosa]